MLTDACGRNSATVSFGSFEPKIDIESQVVLPGNPKRDLRSFSIDIDDLRSDEKRALIGRNSLTFPFYTFMSLGSIGCAVSTAGVTILLVCANDSQYKCNKGVLVAGGLSFTVGLCMIGAVYISIMAIACRHLCKKPESD